MLLSYVIIGFIVYIYDVLSQFFYSLLPLHHTFLPI
jgi:hypothetical protein